MGEDGGKTVRYRREKFQKKYGVLWDSRKDKELWREKFVSIFFTEFSETYGAKEMFEIFKSYSLSD